MTQSPDRHMNMARRLRWRVILVAVLLLTAADGFEGDDPVMRRASLLALRGATDGVVKRLADALDDPDPVVARTAARLLIGRGRASLPFLPAALRSEDLLVRRTVAMGLWSVGPAGLDLLAGLATDQEPLVRQAAVSSLSRLRPRSRRILKLLEEAGKDDDPIVRDAALLAARGSYDTVLEIRLPADGWKFKLDPERVGNDDEWSSPGYDDSGWDDIGIEKAWQLFGVEYIGVAWYRRSIELPKRPAHEKVELAFEGVDESAWVWVNGQYAGAHDIGPAGWDKPFRFDVTDLLEWGATNQFTIRAMNTAHRGGIWRPVRLLALKLAE